MGIFSPDPVFREGNKKIRFRHKDREVCIFYPPLGPESEFPLEKQIFSEEEGFTPIWNKKHKIDRFRTADFYTRKFPTINFPELVSLVYASYKNPDAEASQMVLELLKYRWLFSSTALVHFSDEVIIKDDSPFPMTYLIRNSHKEEKSYLLRLLSGEERVKRADMNSETGEMEISEFPEPSKLLEYGGEVRRVKRDYETGNLDVSGASKHPLVRALCDSDDTLEKLSFIFDKSQLKQYFIDPTKGGVRIGAFYNMFFFLQISFLGAMSHKNSKEGYTDAGFSERGFIFRKE